MKVSESEWKEWAQLPQTKQMREWLEQEVVKTQERWASGAFTRESLSEGALANAHALGAVAGFKAVREWVEGFSTEDSNV